MDVIAPLASSMCRIATAHDDVNNSECSYTFHTPYTNATGGGGGGIVVNLKTFAGTVQRLAFESDHDDDGDDGPVEGLFVRISKRRVERNDTEAGAMAAAATAAGKAEEAASSTTGMEMGEQEETTATAPALMAPAPPTRLGIGVEGGFASDDDRCETISSHSVLLLRRRPRRPRRDALDGDGDGDGVSNVDDKDDDACGCDVVAELPYTDETKPTFPTLIVHSVESVIHHAGSAVRNDVSAWELDDEPKPISKYANDDLPFVDNGVRIAPDPASWKCEKSGDTDNLWLNLSDGYIGGGRKNWDGSGGSNGALDHYQESGNKYPLVVKLGTITEDLETADCYSYAPDENGPVKVPNLFELLEKRGIMVAGLQKTAKTTSELEVELNATYAFDAITESGSALIPVSGPGLQGLQNLGNSCYVNSVVQMLFGGTVPELSSRYGTEPGGDVAAHPLLKGVSPPDAPLDVLCQTTKLGCALTSGIYARPIVPGKSLDKDNGDDSASTDPKYRIAPRMFKHCIGRDHPEFRTNHQQDAAEFMQHLLEKLDRAELGAVGDARIAAIRKKEAAAGVAGGGEGGAHTSSNLFAFKTTARIVCCADGKVKYKDNAAETVLNLRIPMEKATVAAAPDAKSEYECESSAPEQKRQKSDDGDEMSKKEDAKGEEIRTLLFRDCLDSWAAPHSLDDLRWPHLGNAVSPALQRVRFGNFPRYFIVQMQRYELGPDWVPRKLEVNIDVPQEIDLNGLRATGPKEDEDLVPEEDGGGVGLGASGNASPPSIDEGALSQLMDMGFSLNGCTRALTKVGGSDVEAAMNWIFEHNSDADFNDPLPEDQTTTLVGGGGDDGVGEEVVQSLVESLGCFTSEQVRSALKITDGAADRAADWLFSHMDDLDGAIAFALKKQNGPSAEGTPSTASTTAPVEDGDGKYTLVGLISHIGKNTGSGHYVAHLKKGDKWVIFNDERVALSESPPFQHAYLYLFQRKDTVGAPNKCY